LPFFGYNISQNEKNDRKEARMEQIQGTDRLRLQTAHLTCRLLAQLVGSGVVTASELAIISRNLKSLAKTGELAPQVLPKLITTEEAAQMLAISASQFRALEKEGNFPFRRRMIGGKTVRYLNTEIIEYMQVGAIAQNSEAEK